MIRLGPFPHGRSPLTFLDEPAPDAGQPREAEPGDGRR